MEIVFFLAAESPFISEMDSVARLSMFVILRPAGAPHSLLCDPMSAQDFKNKGNDYFKNGKFREAVECAPQIPDSDLSQAGRKKAKRSFVPFLSQSGDFF